MNNHRHTQVQLRHTKQTANEMVLARTDWEANRELNEHNEMKTKGRNERCLERGGKSLHAGPGDILDNFNVVLLLNKVEDPVTPQPPL
jgi:hypothetical protein